jgi:polygalacturonase
MKHPNRQWCAGISTKGHKYLIGTLELKSGIDFHLQGDAELLGSTNKEDYSGEAAVIANGLMKLTISGTGVSTAGLWNLCRIR